MKMMNQQKTQSNFVKHVPCENPECGSSDANSLYDDGHTYCFACNTHKAGDSEHVHTPIQANNKVVKLIEGTIQAIADRGISRATCEAYGVEQDNNRHIYPYFDANGHKVAQKVRNVATKDFNVNGKWSDAVLFGAQL